MTEAGVPTAAYEGWFLQRPTCVGETDGGVFFEVAEEEPGETSVTLMAWPDVDDELWRAACRSATVVFPDGTFETGNCSFSADAWRAEARSEADEVLAGAKAEAETILRESRAEAEKVRAELETETKEHQAEVQRLQQLEAESRDRLRGQLRDMLEKLDSP